MCAEERSSKLYPFYGGCIIIKAAGVKKQLCRLWHGWEAFRPGGGRIRIKGGMQNGQKQIFNLLRYNERVKGNV